MNIFLYTLLVTQTTIACVTLYLHRSQTHRSVIFHPAVAHVMRFWLWLTTGMVTRQWVAVHRKHHMLSDQEGDPHSPQVYGLWRVLFGGALLYAEQIRDNPDLPEQLGMGTPDDWIEQNIYTPLNFWGILVMLIINLMLWGYWGILVWGIQMLWIPFWAAGVVNGLAHWVGYRNTDTRDTSHNLWPIGIIIGGEELHNNHHSRASSPKLSQKWWEFDIGWFYICVLRFLRLARTTS